MGIHLVAVAAFHLARIAHIFARRNNNNNNDNDNDHNSRWSRTVRLVQRRVALARDSSVSLHHDDEQSLYTFSMLAL
ncbi:hypothetical protein RDABS01_026721 [Bienertia sinuspersici]